MREFYNFKIKDKSSILPGDDIIEHASSYNFSDSVFSASSIAVSISSIIVSICLELAVLLAVSVVSVSVRVRYLWVSVVVQPSPLGTVSIIYMGHAQTKKTTKCRNKKSIRNRLSLSYNSSSNPTMMQVT